MRTLLILCAGCLLQAVPTGNAFADDATTPPLRQPASIQQVAFENENYAYFAQDDQASDSPSDLPASVDEAPPIPTADYQPSHHRHVHRHVHSDPWTLPQPAFAQRSGVEVGGWMSGGLYTNAHGVRDNGPLGFNDRSDGFKANQLWLYAEKATDTGGYGTDIGFRFDYVFGTDGIDTQAFGDGGWDSGWNSSTEYGSAIPQLYLELAYNDLTFRLGHFYTIIGWEVVPSPDNFFYSHAYTMYYGEPFTHTGFLASYSASDCVTVYGGWTMGWDSGWENRNDASTFLGGVSLALTDNATLTWAVNSGNFGTAAGDIYMNSIVLELALTDDLTYLLQHDLGNNSGLGANNNEWYGINQYLQYEINDRWAAGMRFEWFRDDDGARVGNVGNYYELTAGLNFRPQENLIIRPEIRGDWFDGVGNPFANGNNDEQLSGGFDVIWTF